MSYDAKENERFLGQPFELYRFTMGTLSWYLTSGDVPRTHETQTYAPDTIDRSEILQNGETDSGSIDVEVPLTSALAEEFLTFVPPYPMFLTIFGGHEGDSEIIVKFQGRVAQATFEKTCKMRVNSMLTAIRKKVPGPVYQTRCNRSLYAPGCDVSQVLHTKEGTIIAIDMNQTRLTLGGGTFEDYWLTRFPADKTLHPTLELGIAQAASGHRMMIAQHTDWNKIILKAPIYGLEVGQTISVSKGCFGTSKHCNAFGNMIRFLGFERMPNKNVFSTGIMKGK